MAKNRKIPNVIPAKADFSGVYNKILIGIFAVFIILITTFRISGDDDLFWHLEIGKYVVENRSVPSTDVFSFSTLGQEWIPFEWGWDVLNFFIYSIGGYASISILRTIFFLLMFYFFYKSAGRLKLNPVISAIVFLLLVFGILDRLLIKPQVSSFVFFSIIIYIFLDHKYSAAGSKKIYFLPLVFLFWVNMHMGVLAGIALFGIFVLAEFITNLKPEFFFVSRVPAASKKQFIILLTVFVISLIVLLLNPHGIHTFTYVYSHLQMKMIEDVFEWRSPFNQLFDGTIFRYVYIAFLGGALIILYYSYKKKDLFAGLLAAVFTVYSFRSGRFSIDFMIITSVFLIIALNYFTTGQEHSNLKNGIPANPAFKIVLIILLAAASASLPFNGLYKLLNFERASGFGVELTNYPVNAVNFLKINNIAFPGSKPFNSYFCGGYLIWEIPGSYNFIDSRFLNDDIYYRYKYLNNKQPGFEQTFENYGFDYVLWFFPKLPLSSIELKTSIASYLFKTNDKWKLVYWDDNSFVFVKNNQRYREIIRQNEYKYVNPYYFIYEKEPLQKATYDDAGRIVEEIQRNYKLNPDGVFINAMVNAFKIPVSK